MAGAPLPGARPDEIPTTEDGFLGGRLRLLQPAKGFRAGIDSVFLAAAVPCRPGERLLEAGLGAGAAALCLLARTVGTHLTGVEIAEDHARLAEENAARNGLSDRLAVIRADVSGLTRKASAAGLKPGSFHHALANPPYYTDAASTLSPHALKAGAHAFGAADLEGWIKVLHTLLAVRGTLSIVHTAEMAGSLLALMEKRFGDIRLAPLFPRAGAAASRVIIQGVKDSRAPLQILPGLVLHGEGNGFTPEAEAVLRHGATWPLR